MTTANEPDSPVSAVSTSRQGEVQTAERVRKAPSTPANGTLLILLGIWTGLVHFVGPYFGYQADVGEAWELTMDRLWFGILPAVVIIIAGTMLSPARNRVVGGFAAWLGAAAGAWLVLAPTLAMSWQTAGPITPTMSLAEQLGFFYGVGLAVTLLATFTAGRMAVRPRTR